MSETNCNNRLVLCEYQTHGWREIKRWFKPDTVINGKHSCGCYDYTYARDAGKRPCILCSEENA